MYEVMDVLCAGWCVPSTHRDHAFDLVSVSFLLAVPKLPVLEREVPVLPALNERTQTRLLRTDSSRCSRQALTRVDLQKHEDGHYHPQLRAFLLEHSFHAREALCKEAAVRAFYAQSYGYRTGDAEGNPEEAGALSFFRSGAVVVVGAGVGANVGAGDDVVAGAGAEAFEVAADASFA